MSAEVGEERTSSPLNGDQEHLIGRGRRPQLLGPTIDNKNHRGLYFWSFFLGGGQRDNEHRDDHFCNVTYLLFKADMDNSSEPKNEETMGGGSKTGLTNAEVESVVRRDAGEVFS
jgi:hypothetical protein